MNDVNSDILLIDSPDGGEIVLENGLIKYDLQFSTAIYLSLFGGNKDDPGKTARNRSWWGNLFAEKESEQIRSRFQYIISGLPMTVKNMRDAEEAARMDLDWLKKDKLADTINIQGKSVTHKTYNLFVEILSKKEKLYESNFIVDWNGGNNAV